jgi:hypothetical protein
MLPPDLAGYYPDWLSAQLLWDDFPWESGLRTTVPDFLAAYTLHDSGWVGLFLDPDQQGSAIAVIRWDTFWTEGRIPFPGGTVAQWPFLLIRYAPVYAVRFTSYEVPGEAPSPRTIGGAEASVISESIHRTVVQDIFGGAVEVEHVPQVDVLCLAPDRTVLPIALVREA